MYEIEYFLNYWKINIIRDTTQSEIVIDL